MGTRLAIRELRVTYTGSSPVTALDGISIDVARGECIGILGESGSGKSTLAHALLGLLPEAEIEGELTLDGRTLIGLNENAWRKVRWRQIALSIQSTASLNPVLRIGDQLLEPLQVHQGMNGRLAQQRMREIITEVGLGDWAANRFPGELSGGERRLVLLAMALICDPPVIILDEPTAGLDPVTRKRVLKLVQNLRQEKSKSIVLLGHDIQALHLLADKVAVLYRGWLAEIGPTEVVLNDPRSPYTWALLNSQPTLASLKELRGIRQPSTGSNGVSGCPFHDRCNQVIRECGETKPVLSSPDRENDTRLVACVRGGIVTVLKARDLFKSYNTATGPFHKNANPVVNEVSLHVREGEVLGLVGATGAGKSTLALLMARLLEPDGGTIEFAGEDLLRMDRAHLSSVRRKLQLLFQDPFEALSPRMTVAEAVREPLDVQKLGQPDERDSRVQKMLSATRLPFDKSFLARHTHELSGGQLQRVALARALVLEPKLLIADEPISMLDPSEQAEMLQLLKQLQVERGMAMLLISHQLAVVLRIADRVLVLDHGRVVEEGTGTNLLVAPRHAVTRRLLSAAGRDALFKELIISRDGTVYPDTHSCPVAVSETEESVAYEKTRERG